LSRELGIQPSLLQHWKRCITGGARVAVTANEDVVPVSELKAAQQRIRELERALGRKTMEVEISRMPCTAGRPARRCREMTHHSTAAICRTLGIGRATPYHAAHGRPEQYAKADDPIVAAQIREIIRQRGSYGYRRVTAMVNRAFDMAYNRKRIRRVMEMNDWDLPRPGRRRSGRAHTGRVARGSSNERWCSDTLQIPCWNGELVELGFILDCHDREVIAHVAVPRKYSASDVQELLETAAARLLQFGTNGARPIPER
jgi:hypothetical protein